MKFIVLWLAELIALIGSGLSQFALGVWAYERTGSATQFSVITLMVMIPTIAVSPIAGTLVDRWDKRWTMILTRVGAGVSMLLVALLFAADRVEVWQVYTAVAVSSIFTATSWLAFLASVTSLVQKEQLGRASGMLQAGNAIGRIASPVLAGALLSVMVVRDIVNVNIAAFILSVALIAPTRIPRRHESPEAEAGKKKSLLREAVYGWKYIRERPGLVGLLIFSIVVNFVKGLILVLFPPLVLSFSTPQVLGLVMSTSGVGMLAGSLFVSVWGGSKHRLEVILIFALIQGLVLCLGGLQPSVTLAAIAAFTYMFCFPIIGSCNHAIWQNKVRLDVQGRVFALRNMASLAFAPLGFLFAVVAAEKVFEPLLVPGGRLAGSVGQLIGVGTGRGIGLLFILSGIFTVLATIMAYLYAPLRRVESELSDEVPDEELPDTVVAGGASIGATVPSAS
jgi:MFS family permease